MPNYNMPVTAPPNKYIPVYQEAVNAFSAQEGDVAKRLFDQNPDSLMNAAGRMFCVDAFGQLAELNDFTPERMAHYALSNSLYVRDKNNALRQIGLENNDGEISFNVSQPVRDIKLSRPSAWTYIKSWFNNQAAKAEIEEYNNMKQFLPHLLRTAGDPKYGIDTNPDMTPIRTDDPVAEAAPEQNVAQQQPQAESVPLNPSQMNPDQFMAHLESVFWKAYSIDLNFILMRDNSTPETYRTAVADILKAQVAKNVWGKANSITDMNERNAFLDGQKRFYTSVTANLQNFVNEKLDTELVENALKNRQQHLFTPEAQALKAVTDQLRSTGVSEYLEQVQAGNAEFKEALRQQQPAPNQVLEHPATKMENEHHQLLQAQLEALRGSQNPQPDPVQQPQPQPAPQVMGGHG